MEDDVPSPPVTTTDTSTIPPSQRQVEESTSNSGFRKGCLSFLVSLQESFGYVKALFVGQAKMMTARTEKEASRADLETAKMQVEATDAAEDIKKRLDISN